MRYEVLFYLHQVSDFNAARTAVENNLQAMQAIIDGFTPLFRQMVEADVRYRLAEHARDAQLRDDFVRMTNARASKD